MFQSSPDAVAGRYGRVRLELVTVEGFNPRPTLWSGATAPGQAGLIGSMQPVFQSSPDAVVGRYMALDYAMRFRTVSILARRCGRALRRGS